jgi:hypothetical protein
MPSIFPCATCGTLLNGTNTFAYQKHMTTCHWPGKNKSFPLSSIFTSSSPGSLTPVEYFWPTTFQHDSSIHLAPSSDLAPTSSVLGKRKRGDDSAQHLRIDSPLDVSMSGMSTPSSPSSITSKVADFLASVGVDVSQIGQQRVYFTLTRPSAP